MNNPKIIVFKTFDDNILKCNTNTILRTAIFFEITKQ